jgi:hypothetical protein|tara:strand:+ start:351 stop:827 length:477 start_codon:yes stop_codon:yes gene_type:complete
MLYSYKGQYPKPLPERIRLSDGSTRTDSSTFTEEELTDAGYVAAGDSPSFDGDTQKVIWNGTAWEVVSLTTEEINSRTAKLWVEVRETRDLKINEVEWRVMRNLSETRLGITTTTDSISDLDTYIQALRDITTSTTNPLEVVWPTLGPLNSDEITPSP